MGRIYEIIALDERVGSSHMSVQDMMVERLWRSMLPKDIDALIKYADSIGINLELLKNIQEINNDIRSGY